VTSWQWDIHDAPKQLLLRGVRPSQTAITLCGAAMPTPAIPSPYKQHRFPGEIINHAIWLYYRFSLSHRDVEELLFVRGVIVS
jgi:hypothetical protein